MYPYRREGLVNIRVWVVSLETGFAETVLQVYIYIYILFRGI